jgi:hypothetical protein
MSNSTPQVSESGRRASPIDLMDHFSDPANEPAILGSSPAKAGATSDVRRIPLTKINADPAIQQRVNGTSEEVVAEYAQAMRDGVTFPPPIVFSDGGVDHHLADGFHRVAAYRRAHPDKQEIECEVRHGGHDDALLCACGANASHGLPRTRADKEKIVLLLLRSEEWSQWSDREIARRCAVSHPFVSKVRRDHLETFPDTGRKDEDEPGRTQATSVEGTPSGVTEAPVAAPDHGRSFARRGKQHTMKTAKIGYCRPMAGETAVPPPSADAAPKKTSTNRNGMRMDRAYQIADHIQKIGTLLTACDCGDQDIIRQNNKPYLDGWFGPNGKLRSQPAEFASSPSVA